MISQEKSIAVNALYALKCAAGFLNSACLTLSDNLADCRNGLQAFQKNQYNFRLGSFEDAAVRQFTLSQWKNDLKVR
jgi:hypothetical protein